MHYFWSFNSFMDIWWIKIPDANGKSLIIPLILRKIEYLCLPHKETLKDSLPKTGIWVWGTQQELKVRSKLYSW